MSNIPEQNSLILIIDDNVDMIRLLSNILKHLGQILFATSGEAGIEMARTRQPDLILLDVDMPHMDGYQVCRTLKNDATTQNSAVIFVTAHTTTESEIIALEAGAVDYITKPLNPPIVRARVQTHLRLQHYSTTLAQLANKDSLSGLYNRRFFDDRLDNEFQRHRRQKFSLSLAFIDIDHFKQYNDGYGHQAGDQCLQKIAHAINISTKRPDEIVARYGGEEFVVLLPHTSSEEAQKYGDLICQCIVDLNIAHAYSNTASNVTISVGVTSTTPTENDVAVQMLKVADEALYQAKSEGRNRSKILLQK